MKQIKIFDTTLRDGEQSPGCSMNLSEKIEIAKSLERMKVDIIEAGFAISSPGDFESVREISKVITDCTVASLARASAKDIDAAYEAVKNAADPRIHLFIATSPLHMQYKLKMTPQEVLEKTAAMVAYAKKYCFNIEFSAEDAMRSDPGFLAQVVSAAIKSGATVINIPDTVGYTTPPEMQAMIEYLLSTVENARKAEFSVHCHNDLGMACANALAGVRGGALQVECTMNGLGERAGNTALEEVVMALHTRKDIYNALPRLDTTQIYHTSRLVYSTIGMNVPLNKPIVGKNAFAHEAGIHQHGVMENKQTYEILTAESVGIKHSQMVLGKHSGRHAFEKHLSEMGHQLSDSEFEECFLKFKDLCDKKKNVTDSDIEALAHNNVVSENKYKLQHFDVHAGSTTSPTGVIGLEKDGVIYQEVSMGDGPVDAAYNAINKIINPPPLMLEKYSINAVSEGEDTLGEAVVMLKSENRIATGRGLSTDIIEASILAYLNAVNKII